MQTFHGDTVVKKGELHLTHLPFADGESVHVLVSSTSSTKLKSLKGTVVKYDKPFAPVAEHDWEAGR